MVHHPKLECPVKKKRIDVFKVKVTAKAWNVRKRLSGKYLLNRSTYCNLNHSDFCNHTWYSGVLSWVGVSCWKKWFAVIKVKLTASAYVVRLWLFLLYVLNCIPFLQSDLAWWHILICQSVVWKKEERLLCSRSRSRWNFKMSVIVCPENFFSTTEPFITNLGIVMHKHDSE